MNSFRKGVLISLFVIGLPALSAHAAATSYDGAWSVRIASSSEACGNGSVVSIGINNGEVASSSAVVNASGRVAAAGNINVTLSSGIKRAVGFGRLSGTSGSGTWSGPMCKGTWTAQRM